ncbi:MAG: CAAX prenyl protease-related protein [Armatimonadaceae bacterium]
MEEKDMTTEAPANPDSSSPASEDPLKAAIPYAAPMILFLVLTYAEGKIEGFYPLAYTLKVAIVTGALLYFRRAWQHEIRMEAKVLLPAVGIGLVTLAEWILLDKWIPYPALGTRTGYNPLTEIPDPLWRNLFLGVRFYGLALLVPVMEEIFWRSFLLRYVTDMDRWKTLPVGTFSVLAFVVVAALFALAHPEWLVAAICAMLYAGLLFWTRSLFAVILAHAVTNFGLGIYVLLTGEWKYW